MLPASFEQVERPGHIRFKIDPRVLDGGPDSRPAAQVHNGMKRGPAGLLLFLAEEISHGGPVRNVQPQKAEPGRLSQKPHTVFLEPRIIGIVQIVEPGDIRSLLEEKSRHTSPNEPGGTRHEQPAAGITGNGFL